MLFILHVTVSFKDLWPSVAHAKMLMFDRSFLGVYSVECLVSVWFLLYDLVIDSNTFNSRAVLMFLNKLAEIWR